MDRRVSLPGFSEISRVLPKPVPLPTSGPQPIPYERGTHKSPTTPLQHQSISDSAYGFVAGGNSNTYYPLGPKATHYDRHYDQPQQQQPHSFPTVQSHPRQPPNFASSSPPQPQSHFQQTSAYRQPLKVSYGADSSMIALYEGQQSHMHGNNVHAAAQVTNSMERPVIATTSPSSSLPQQPSSFMQSQMSSRYSAYHMPGAPPLATASLPSSAASRISPPLSPNYRHPRSTTIDAASRAGASFFASQRRHSAANTAAAQIPRAAPPGISAAGPIASRHMPTQLHHMREHSVPELIGERDDEDDDEDESLGYDDTRHSPDKAMASDGTNMSSSKIRTIHKLAERRRRREMKNLFDTLRKCLPVDKSIRLSKWEVLKKAVEIISAQDAEIHMLRLHLDSAKALPSNVTQ
ncbi:hypothetical protein IWW56_004977 [Coemansia sp. RSA 2131]|nr:hypothetical protein IWW56_004977 [Coemansia sp. RSA 2131]